MSPVRTRRALCAVAVAIIAVPLLAGPTSARGSRPTVVLIGDSVMAAMNPGYTDAARKVIGAGGWNVVIDAAVNRTTAQGAVVAQARRAQADTVIVMLGHNDGGTPSRFKARAQQVLRALAKVPRVYWLTMREPRYAGANKVLRDLRATFPNLRLVDWAHSIRSGWTGQDGLHLSGAGATGMARLILTTIGAR